MPKPHHIDLITIFITLPKTIVDWDAWQPTEPTLIIVDYAADRAKMLREALLSFSQRQNEMKVRFLLLERTAGDYWWKDLRGHGTESYASVRA